MKHSCVLTYRNNLWYSKREIITTLNVPDLFLSGVIIFQTNPQELTKFSCLSTLVKTGLLPLQSFTNCHFHFLFTVESGTFEILLRFSKISFFARAVFSVLLRPMP